MCNLHRCLLFASILSTIGILEGLEMCSTDHEGEIRLVAGKHQYEGRLEVCLYRPEYSLSLWGTFCINGWGLEETVVACRQLGVPANITMNVFGVSFIGERSSTPVRWTNTNCSGEESRLVDCFYNNFTCLEREDVGLICAQPNPECSNGDVRIVDAFGRNSTEGRVEFCRGRRWGTVCDYKWNDMDAAVVCKQLNLSQANVPRTIQRDLVPSAANNVPISLDFVQCTKDSQGLKDCPAPTHVQQCTHVHDAGVSCPITSECTVEASVRLVGGNESTEGRVEYCRDNLWVSVCRDSWDHRDAQVVCRQLGFVGVSVAEVLTFEMNFDHVTKNNIGRVQCEGEENKLFECPSGESCILGYGAGVKCYNESNCAPDSSVRVVNGVISDEIGTVELCYGDWGYVCGDSWGDADAQVLCRQIGLTGGIGYPTSLFGSETGRFNLNNVECLGNETSLSDCSHDGYGAHNCRDRMTKQAAVICGTSAGAGVSRCTKEQLNKSVATSETSLQVGNLGTCERYQRLSSICNTVFNESTGYVFIRNSSGLFNQSWLSYKLDQILSDTIIDGNTTCSLMIKSVVCNYFMPTCGNSGFVHIPRAVCPNDCSLVQNGCSDEWSRINTVLVVNGNLGAINCEATQHLLNPLPTCCIEIPEINVQGTTTSSEEATMPAPSSQHGTTVAIVISLLALLSILIVAVVFVVLYVISSKRKKVTLRRLQLDLLSSASTRSTDYRSPTYLVIDDDGKLLRSTNGSVRGPLAAPNPYTTKSELLASPFLTPQDSGMMGRISSSIIRELTSNLLIPHSRLKLLDCVGQGEFGVVYKAHYTEPEGDLGYKTSIVAVKTLKGVFDQIQVDKIMEESIKMKSFDHPNVLNLMGVCLDAGPAPYVVIPYMANGSLLHYLKKERRNLILPVGTDDDVRSEVCKRLVVMCMQISCGMEYLAHEKFIHRDLAARNCMIDIHFVIKIADFGLSEDVYAKSYYRQSETDKSTKLPVKWMAPESLTDGLFSEKSDVWSYGVTCWELFSGGKTPYPGMDPMSLVRMLEADKRLNKPLNTACPDEMYQVMQRCWEKSPDRRPTFSDLVETISEYTEKIAGYLDISLYNPFVATYEEIRSPEDEQIVSDPDQVVRCMKNKDNKLKSTPCNSTLNSPVRSPYFTPRGSPMTSPMASPILSRNRPAPGILSWHASPQPHIGIRNHVETPSQTGEQTKIALNGRRLSVGAGPSSQAFHTPQRRLSASATIQIKITESETDV